MRTRWLVMALSVMWLQGCMMGMMGGMGGMDQPMSSEMSAGDSSMSAGRQRIVKEVVAGEMRVTADFPVFGPRDSLEYSVVLRDLDGRTITADATLFLMVSSATDQGMRHDLPAPTRLLPTRRSDGSFVFRPSIPRDGEYRLTVLVERVGATALDPLLRLDQVVQLSTPVHSAQATGNMQRKAGLNPLVVLGAGLMAVMMIFTIR